MCIMEKAINSVRFQGRRQPDQFPSPSSQQEQEAQSTQPIPYFCPIVKICVFSSQSLTMAPIANLTPPPLSAANVSVTNAATFENATEVVFFSVFLHAILFISSEGELRVNPACSAIEEVKLHERMLRYCVEDDDSITLCTFASGDKKFMLSMDAASGMLRTIRTTDGLNARSRTTCTVFEETTVSTWSGDVTTLTGCPGTTHARHIVFSGRRLRKNSCAGHIGPFSQIVSIPSKHRQLYVHTNLNVYALQNHCRANPAKRCSVRESYPLHFPMCEVSY